MHAVPALVVSVIAVTLAIAACGQGDQVRDTTDSTDAEVDVPRRAVGLLPTGASEFSVVDVEQVLDGEAPPDYRDQLEDQWSDALLDIGVKFEDVSTMVVGTVDGDDLIILKGDFDFEYVRDALSDSDFQESDYRDFELWEDDRTGTAALIEGDEYVLFGDAEGAPVRDVLRGLSRGSRLLGYEDDSETNELLDRVGSGWYVRVGGEDDCGGVVPRYCEAVAWSADSGRGSEVDVTWAFLFRDERSADSAVGIIEEVLYYVRDVVLVDIEADDRYVVATGVMDEDDWTPSTWESFTEEQEPEFPAPAPAAPAAAPAPAPAPAPDDHADGFAGATSISVGDTLNGDVETGNDVDMFSFRVREDYLYRIRVRHRSISDTVLTLYDADGEYLAEDDDSAGDGAALLEWESSRSGIHYVEVRGYDSDQTGRYRLELDGFALPTASAPAPTAAPAAPAAAPTVSPPPAPAPPRPGGRQNWRHH